MLLSKPVIAAVEGYAVAGGLELALWCDLRVAARDAVFGVFCRRWGVPLIDGGTVRLPRLIGHSHALDLILTGRGVSGDEALAHGPRQPARRAGPGALAAAVDPRGASSPRSPQMCLREDRASSYEQWGARLRRRHAGRVRARHDGARVGRDACRRGPIRGGAGRHGSRRRKPACGPPPDGSVRRDRQARR